MGNNSCGFKNEDKIKDALNNKKFDELNSNLKDFIKFICPSVEKKDKLKCEKIAGNSKCDLQIIVKGKSYRVSVKKGAGNSVHQEPVETFIKYLKKELKANDDLCDDIRFFIWGDGTIDGTGKKEDRLSSNEINKKYPRKVNNIKNFFEKNKEKLIERFLLTGVYQDKINYIYYGDETSGLWASKEEFLNIILDTNSNKRAIVPIGKLSFQAWNRAIKGNKSENKRGVIQLKWASLKKDLEYIHSNRK
jgi:hypothetical protein